MKVYKYRSIEKDVFERDFEAIKNNSFFSSNYSMLKTLLTFTLTRRYLN
ncbi:hypothetical protein J2W57_001198 [Chryseobacterium ginsenosidimutans]|uniref:Uncharacterized protein n=1 Tax=Chryseobacterium geocarposphaerae TaxID=1416776 RepID=A0ABU1LEA0_9FLAO|nr:hypothetical protein [Chryseobacterium geocarposphaerae]MDR6697838.1 hypothetical protein [Chryseobacterium ginsenosidimutans]